MQSWVAVKMRRLLLPGNGVPYIMVCKNAFSRVIGFGIDLWNTLRHLVDIGAFDPNVNSFIGKTGNNQLSPNMTNTLRNFHQKTSKFSEPSAARVV